MSLFTVLSGEQYYCMPFTPKCPLHLPSFRGKYIQPISQPGCNFFRLKNSFFARYNFSIFPIQNVEHVLCDNGDSAELRIKLRFAYDFVIPTCNAKKKKM